MTSGQSGPQGWTPPPSDQPGGGYAPAPMAPVGAGAPPALDRPTTVRAGIGAFVASLALGLVGSLVTLLNWDTIKEQTILDAQQQLDGADAELARQTAEVVMVVGLVVGIGFAALYLMFIWFAWQGRNWARIVLWVFGGLGVLSGLVAFGAGGSPLPFLSALGAFQTLFLAVGIVLLALKPSSDWYRYRGWQRANGQA